MASRFLLIALLLSICTSFGQTTDTMSGIFDDRIKTVRMSRPNESFTLPVVTFSDQDCLELSFDLLADNHEYLRYSIQHCDARWNTSNLIDSEFLDGFNEGIIDTYEYSNATLVPYIHYSLDIPNDNVRPTISGNYLIKVYSEENPDKILFQQRFMVSEQTAPMQMTISTETLLGFRSKWQDVAIEVDTQRAHIDDPFNEMLLVVSQNGRIDNEVYLSHPLRMQGKTAIYDHLKELVFDAGNEYRRMEIINEYYPGMGVEEIQFYEPYRHYVLIPDNIRANEPYSYDQTQNGRFLVRKYDSTESDIDADYGIVHFTLEAPYNPNKMIFLDGDFVSRRFDPNSLMTFNRATGLYETAILLKQGAYNYQYLTVDTGQNVGKTADIEGDFYQTNNEYFARLYHRRHGERFDRLIGVVVGTFL